MQILTNELMMDARAWCSFSFVLRESLKLLLLAHSSADLLLRCCSSCLSLVLLSLSLSLFSDFALLFSSLLAWFLLDQQLPCCCCCIASGCGILTFGHQYPCRQTHYLDRQSHLTDAMR